MQKDVGSMGNSGHIPIFPSVFCARRSRCLRQWSRYNHSKLHDITHEHHGHLQVGACTYEWMDNISQEFEIYYIILHASVHLCWISHTSDSHTSLPHLCSLLFMIRSQNVFTFNAGFWGNYTYASVHSHCCISARPQGPSGHGQTDTIPCINTCHHNGDKSIHPGSPCGVKK